MTDSSSEFRPPRRAGFTLLVIGAVIDAGVCLATSMVARFLGPAQGSMH